ncbi:ABC transporter permease [Acidithiobacillus ferrooxidans]|uniref:ABC transporter permease n=1 Tax=Acidithiobacillus ferrooxidans TaxID=920 RepID=UPI001C07993A|nr:ABC transporter permease [Acidithiobacillus ferrooxidans]MBU2774848.1 ABC transporter permease [Acidithiobacillus ferrooxidans]
MDLMKHVHKFYPAIVLGIFVLGVWQIAVQLLHVPKYLFPSPFDIVNALGEHGRGMLIDLGVTIEIALCGFALAVVLGGAIAVMMVLSKRIENAVFPYVIIVQVTPIVALAPLIVLLMKNTFWSLVFISLLISIFPIVSNTTLGLKSVPEGLVSVFGLYNATKVQVMFRLRFMSALPYFLGSLRISSGLALVGAVVGGFVAGSTGGNSGIAYDILQDGYNLEVSQLFASVFLLAVTGIAFFAFISMVNWRVLHRWHESYALER